AGEMRLEPVLVKRQQGPLPAQDAKAVYVRIAEPAPIDELDAQLERALGPADEVVLIELQGAIELAQVRNRRLTDADRADLIRFDQADGVITDQHLGHGRGGHPAGGAAADDDDALDGSLFHFVAHTNVATLRSGIV